MSRGFVVQARSREMIRRLAESIRQTLSLEARQVPIVDVLEKVWPKLYADFDFQVYDPIDMEAEFGPGTYGVTLQVGDTIILREDVYARAQEGMARDRFTVAHELGHYLMHRGEGFAMPQRSAIEVPYFRDSEWQANTFAAEFLVDTKNLLQLGLNNLQDIRHAFGVSYKTASIQLTMAKKMAIKELELR